MSILLCTLAASLSTALPAVHGAALVPVATTPPSAAQDAAQLVPADATMVFRIDSLASMRGLMSEFAEMFQEQFGDEELMDFLEDELGLPGDLGKLDRSQPLYVALTIDMAGPVRTFVVPSTDAAGLVASMADEKGPGGASWVAATSGNYVGVSNKEGYALGGEPSGLLSELAPGTVSMRIDLGTLISTFRPLIEMGLEQAELQMDQIAEMKDTPFDITPMLEAYLDFTWDVVDSADRFDLSLGTADGGLDTSFAFRVKDGSPLADFGGERTVDLREFPGVILPGSSVSAIVGADWEALMNKMEPMMDGVLGIYPEPLRSTMTRYMEAVKSAQALMGPVVATSANFGADGMRVAYYMTSETPGELMATLGTALQSFSNPEVGITVGAPAQAQVAGRAVVTYPMKVDFEKITRLMAEDELSEVDAERMREVMDSLYGEEGLEISMATSGSTLVVVLGSEEAFVAQALAGLDAAGVGGSAALKRGLAASAGSSFAFAYSIDFGTMMGQMAEMMKALGVEDAELDELPTSPLPIAVWGAVRTGVWTGGARTQMADLKRFMAEAQAMEQARSKKWQEELEAKMEELPEEVDEEEEDGR